jgi:hypothetical protein
MQPLDAITDRGRRCEVWGMGGTVSQFFGPIPSEFSIPANQTLHWRALSQGVTVSAVKGSGASPWPSHPASFPVERVPPQFLAS